ncbi:RNA-directed DNA polymerase, eukaryota, partial [Tanacetum coccineum]
IHNEKLVQTLLKGHSILSLEGSLSEDCDVEKNGKWSCIYAVGSHEYQMVCTRLDIASADVDQSQAAYMTLTGAWKKEIWLKGLLAESGYELSLVVEIDTGALVKGSSRSEVSAQVEGSGEFSVASSRKFIDDQSIVGANQQTRWIKVVPRKINILAWKIRFDFLPTRLNLSRRGVEIQSIICPTCNKEVESTSRVFFSCSLVRDIYRKIAVWWELSYSDFQKFDDWFDWLLAARVSSKQRLMLEGIFYIAWWLIWNNRNKYLFDSKTPSKEIILDVLVSKSILMELESDSIRQRVWLADSKNSESEFHS